MFARQVTEHRERREAEREANMRQLATPSRALVRGSYGGAVSGEAVSKAPDGYMKAVRESAKGEDCTVRLPGCAFDPAQTIWSHFRGSAGGKAMSFKSFDLAGGPTPARSATAFTTARSSARKA